MEREHGENRQERDVESVQNHHQGAAEQLDETVAPSAFQAFRSILDKAKGKQPIADRRELSRDKSKSLFLVVGAGMAILLIFFGLFSSPKSRMPLPGETPRGNPNLGRRTTSVQEQNDSSKTLTPLLSADVRDTDNASGSQVTAKDVGGTSPRYNEMRVPANPLQPTKPLPGRARNDERYALKNVDFSDPVLPQTAPAPGPPLVAHDSDSALKKPSLVFVRTVEGATPVLQAPPQENGTVTEILPAGTRLVSRLVAPVSSAVSSPVVAVVEYNYERSGEIVLPAGSRVVGKLSQVTASGFVAIQFDQLEMPDGNVEKIDATAMDLNFGPLKGNVSGRNRGRNFLVRSMTGIGTVASYVIGGQGGSGFNGPISENSLLRERLAENIGMAGQDEINTLAANQRIVVTIPGNTRFYIVLQKSSSEKQVSPTVRSADANSLALSGARVPSLEDLRELIQLRNELNQMYSQNDAESKTSRQ